MTRMGPTCACYIKGMKFCPIHLWDIQKRGERVEERTTSATGGQKGVKLERHDLVPVGPLKALAEHFGVGARKYEDNQWRRGYEWSKGYAAIMRHVTEWWLGNDYDICPEGGMAEVECSFITEAGDTFEPLMPRTCYNHTGSHHLTAVAWHSFTLQEFNETHPDYDDRVK